MLLSETNLKQRIEISSKVGPEGFEPSTKRIQAQIQFGYDLTSFGLTLSTLWLG
jgi:hypothetical protein